MSKPEKEIDGANVLYWAWSGAKPFGVIRYKGEEKDGQIAFEIYGLAICRYDNDNRVYRFSCEKNWETQQDGLYDSIEEAKADLPEQYKEVPANWILFE
jgi:hypothetical protein